LTCISRRCASQLFCTLMVLLSGALVVHSPWNVQANAVAMADRTLCVLNFFCVRLLSCLWLLLPTLLLLLLEHSASAFPTLACLLLLRCTCFKWRSGRLWRWRTQHSYCAQRYHFSVFFCCCLSLQSYGIKVGYGAGGPNAQTIKPGEAAPAKSSSCC
jgi:hypothetical protein